MTTQKQALALIRQLGLKVKVIDGEYQVTIPGRPESTYFTEDANDAIQTARHMATEMKRKRKRLGIFGA